MAFRRPQRAVRSRSGPIRKFEPRFCTRLTSFVRCELRGVTVSVL